MTARSASNDRPLAIEGVIEPLAPQPASKVRNRSLFLRGYGLASCRKRFKERFHRFGAKVGNASVRCGNWP